jgi:hypothetical protein
MDTASRYNGRMMERLNLPRLATLALALLIGLQLAWIVTGALGPSPKRWTPASP